MISSARRTAIACTWALMLVATAQAQGSSAGVCRQGVLALIVMIDAEEHDRSHYRSTVASVVETCGPPAAAAKPASAASPFDKAACGRLALAMLDGIEGSKLDNPQFVGARDEFAGKCLAK
jgi:hypothetical protein